MLNKPLRIGLGITGVLIGTVLFVLPGSMLFLLGGLMLLSFDFPRAKRCLKQSQRMMSRGANKLDKHLYRRKFK